MKRLSADAMTGGWLGSPFNPARTKSGPLRRIRTTLPYAPAVRMRNYLALLSQDRLGSGRGVARIALIRNLDSGRAHDCA
jgi:hypothetical protein